MTKLKQRMLEDLRIRNYSPSTVACYTRSVADFESHFNKSPDNLGAEEIRHWQLYLLDEKKVKLPTYIQAVCGLRFFYRNTLHRKLDVEGLPLPRYETKLPVILSKAEVKALLEAPVIDPSEFAAGSLPIESLTLLCTDPRDVAETARSKLPLFGRVTPIADIWRRPPTSASNGEVATRKFQHRI